MKGIRVTEDEIRALLVDKLEIVTSGEFEAAIALARRLHLPIADALAERGRVPPKFLLQQLAQAWNVRFTDLKVTDVKPLAIRRVREEYARMNTLMPFDLSGDDLSVAMIDPRDHQVIAELQKMTRLRIVPHLAPEIAIVRAQLLYRGDLLDLLKQAADEQTSGLAVTGRQAQEGGAIQLLTRVLEYAALTGASDIHIEPFEHEAVVRYRIDGVLHEVLTVSPAALVPLIARIKVLSGMRIDDRRSPQDGRFDGDLGLVKLDLRVSSLPTHWGEKVVMRVLSKEERSALDLETLGLVESDFNMLVRNISRPYGMVLVTGPTGCGKTTTLYAMLERLGVEHQSLVNISTLEDPIEMLLPRVAQVAVNPSAGIDFANGLRALLRQDPDIIMVGEIRDRETAEIAVRAALVGRLLISTLHTNESTSAITRLIDMGIEPFLIASTLVMVVAQRLVRRICMGCRESVTAVGPAMAALREREEFAPSIAALQAQGVLGTGPDPFAGVRLFAGRGCAQCGGSGFRGRLGIFELFQIDDDIRRLTMERKDMASLRSVAVAKGMKTMFQDALQKMFLGETTPEEVLRVAL
jgi:type IV pilus assembly protein PilB